MATHPEQESALTAELAAAAKIIRALLECPREVRLEALAIVARLMWDGRSEEIPGW